MKSCQNKKVINSAIAHLNGYVYIVEKSSGLKPLAVISTIKDLKKLRKCK